MISNSNNHFLTLITVVAIFLSSCSTKKISQASNTENGDPQKLRVMAYNIHHSNPPARPNEIDIDAIAVVIRSEDPDLVAVQEVDVNTARSGAFNQAEVLAEKLDMHFYFGKAIDYQGGAYGQAILSRYPLKETRVHRLPSEDGSTAEPRIMVTAQVELPNGTAIHFGTTHLHAGSDAINRQLQVQEIVKIAKGVESPFIVAGDFNAIPDSKVIQTMKTEFKSSCEDCPFTSSASNPRRTIDYIFYRDPSNNLVVEEHRAIPEKKASDHLPVVAVFTIQE